MALIKSFKPTKFASLFDVFDADFEALDEMGVKVEVKPTSFSVLGPKGQNIVGNIGLNKGAVSMAQQGDLPAIAKAPVKAAINSAFAHAMKQSNWQHAELDPTKAVDFVEEVSSTSELFKGMTPIADGVDAIEADESGDFEQAVDDIEAEEAMEATAFKDIDIEQVKPDPVDVYFDSQDEAILEGYKTKILSQNLNKMSGEAMQMSKVKLKDAEALYQPVGSTSGESIYHCIGITTEGLKFAARRSEQSLSIRVEGPVKNNAPALIAAGFNEDYIAKGYTSVHFHGIDDLMAQRALGAVLFGTGMTFATVMPDLEVIAGKGA